MWDTLLLINSVILALVATFLVYSAGAMILLLNGKLFVMALFLFIFFSITQVALAALNS